MRPLDKGNTPTDAKGNSIIVTDYKNWRDHLITRIGYYCAYCNQPLSHNLQVEHVVPKKPAQDEHAGSFTDWENMLLACGPCNNAKDNKPIDPDSYYLPEIHNTHLPFSVQIKTDQQHAIVVEREGLNEKQQEKAQKTIKLLNLDNVDTRSAIVDIRSKKRKEAILSVRSAKCIYEMALKSPTYNAEDVANAIARFAKTCGFFSLWYDEFANEPLIMEKLTDNTIIQGTARECFNEKDGFKPVFRNKNNEDDPF